MKIVLIYVIFIHDDGISIDDSRMHRDTKGSVTGMHKNKFSFANTKAIMLCIHTILAKENADAIKFLSLHHLQDFLTLTITREIIHTHHLKLNTVIS